MRIYCDSNIFRKAKRTSSQFNESVHNSLEKLKDCFVFVFSEGHLHDLEKSPETYRNEDLLHMETYVKNCYFYRDPIKKDFHFFLATPFEAYKDIDFKAINDFFQDPHGYFNSMFDFEGGEEIGKLFKSLFDLPLFEDVALDLDDNDPTIKDLLNSFKGVRSINDALKKMGNIDQMLHNKKEYKKYKGLISRYINREEYSYERWSLDFNEKMKETAFNRSFTDLVDMTISESDKDDDYTRFVNTYTTLEFYGVTEERKGKKKQLKQNSYWDIHKDAEHSFYASKTDYLVSDDNGLLTKAFITYQLLGIQTVVLSVKDLIDMTPNFIANEVSKNSFYDVITDTIESGNIISDKRTDTAVYQTPFLVFNYFNHIQKNIYPQYYFYQLFRSSKCQQGIIYAEIALLIKKLTKLFGEDLIVKDLTDLKGLAKSNNDKSISQWIDHGRLIIIDYEKNNTGADIICVSLFIPKPRTVFKNNIIKLFDSLKKLLKRK